MGMEWCFVVSGYNESGLIELRNKMARSKHFQEATTGMCISFVKNTFAKDSQYSANPKFVKNAREKKE